jgi:hypothetical protein
MQLNTRTEKNRSAKGRGCMVAREEGWHAGEQGQMIQARRRTLDPVWRLRGSPAWRLRGSALVLSLAVMFTRAKVSTSERWSTIRNPLIFGSGCSGNGYLILRTLY